MAKVTRDPKVKEVKYYTAADLLSKIEQAKRQLATMQEQLARAEAVLLKLSSADQRAVLLHLKKLGQARTGMVTVTDLMAERIKAEPNEKIIADPTMAVTMTAMEPYITALAKCAVEVTELCQKEAQLQLARPEIWKKTLRQQDAILSLRSWRHWRDDS
jgi:hypothetical protein